MAFTEEMDLWWVRGPINFWSDGGRVVEVRCEPGVGGRIIEVLDDPASGEVLERARLTQWEPGVRLGLGERRSTTSRPRCASRRSTAGPA